MRTLQFSFWCKQYTVHSCKGIGCRPSQIKHEWGNASNSLPNAYSIRPIANMAMVHRTSLRMVDCMWTTGLHVGSRGAQEIEHHQEFIGSLLQMTVDLDQTAVKAVSNVFQTATCGLRGRQTWMWFVLS